MTNEEMTLRIQQGEQDLIPELWDQVEKFVRLMAKRQLLKLCGHAAVELDDFYDAGYIAFIRAVEGFDAARDTSFITYLALTLKGAFAEAAGYRSKKQQQDLLHSALSFETPLGDDDLTLGDTISDAGAAIEDTERQIYLEELHNELERTLAQLPERQVNVIRRHFYEGDTLEAIGSDLHISAETVRQNEKRGFRYMRRPNISKRLLTFLYPDGERRLDERTNFYRPAGVRHFDQAGSSSVEETVYWREDQRQRERDREFDKRAAAVDREIRRMLDARPDLRERLAQIEAADSRDYDDPDTFICKGA